MINKYIMDIQRKEIAKLYVPYMEGNMIYALLQDSHILGPDNE